MHAEDVETPGSILRRTREAGGRSLADISCELKIRRCHLEAIESDCHEGLPALAFSTGFVRTYARLLGLDPHALAAAWRAAACVKGEPPSPEFKVPEPVAEPRLPGRSAIALAGVGVFAIYFGWIADFGTGGDTSTISPVPARLTGAVLADAPGQPSGASDVPASVFSGALRSHGGAALAASLDEAPKVTSLGVELVAEKDCWIRVIDQGGEEVWSGVLKTGERWSPKSGDLRLMTSNAGGLRVIVDGKEMGLLGEGGAIMRDIPLDAERLRKRENLAMHQAG